jgi:opacity protein-like surface antigen
MKKTLIASLILATTLNAFAGAAELPQAGTFTGGAQVSFGNIDHDRFSSDEDGTGQVMLYLDYYFKPDWAVEVGLNTGTNVQDWICDHEYIDVDDDYCVSNDESTTSSPESDVDFYNIIVALRYDKKATANSFVYGKLGAQYFDYEMKEGNTIFEEDSGTGIFSELGWRHEWSNNLTVNVGYQFLGMGDLSTSSVTSGLGYRF